MNNRFIFVQILIIVLSMQLTSSVIQDSNYIVLAGGGGISLYGFDIKYMNPQISPIYIFYKNNIIGIELDLSCTIITFDQLQISLAGGILVIPLVWSEYYSLCITPIGIRIPRNRFDFFYIDISNYFWIINDFGIKLNLRSNPIYYAFSIFNIECNISATYRWPLNK